MTAKRKTLDLVTFKALDAGEPDGTFEAIVSVFDNVDHQGDIVRRGAFRDAIAKMKKARSPWPVVFSHRHSDIDSIIGLTLDAAELKAGDPRIPANAPPALKAGGGLWVKGKVDLDGEEPFVEKLWRRMKDGRIVQWSFMYDVLDGGVITVDGKDYFELRTLDVVEVGPTLLGANDATRTLALKARAAGRVALAKTIDLVGELAELDALEAELDSSVDEADVDATLSLLEEIAAAEVVDLTGETDPSAAAGDDATNLRDLVAEVVTEVLARRSTPPAAGAATVTGDTEGKGRGKTDEDRTGGKSAEDLGLEDPTTSPHRSLLELETLVLEVD